MFVNLYICVFMTCSTSCCLYDTLMDPWNAYMFVCTCVCMYVHEYQLMQSNTTINICIAKRYFYIASLNNSC